MLNQVIHWLQMSGTVLEGLLLARILFLKLQRVYLWVTLYWAINLLVDVSAWTVGFESQEALRLFFYTRFVFAVLYPLAAWDVFEEISKQIAKLRKVHSMRLLSSLLTTAIFGFIASMLIDDQESLSIPRPVAFMGAFLWLGSASACLLFTWNVRRAVRKQQLTMPHNTSVWAIFFLLTFVRAILDCGMLFAQPLFAPRIFDGIEIVFSSFDLGLAVWCLLKLRALPSDAASLPARAAS
jgi:hypothetical protein